jgi:hypothetical protein
LRGIAVGPAATAVLNTGHHHLLIHAKPGSLDEPLPVSNQVVHLGNGETEVAVGLSPGSRTRFNWFRLMANTSTLQSCRSPLGFSFSVVDIGKRAVMESGSPSQAFHLPYDTKAVCVVANGCVIAGPSGGAQIAPIVVEGTAAQDVLPAGG